MPEETIVRNDFVNPHVGNPALAKAYSDGYHVAAFGSHQPVSPFPPGPENEAWHEGFFEGEARFTVYKKGFKRGITLGFLGLLADPSDPAMSSAPFPPGDKFNAWVEGRADGFRTAHIVTSEISDKADQVAGFDTPASTVRFVPIGNGERIWFREYAGGGGIYVQRPDDIDLPATASFAVGGPINVEYQKVGGLSGFLGLPVGDTRRLPDGRGMASEFQHGTMYFTPTTGAHEVHGAIRDRYLKLGGPGSLLGYPTSNELDETASGGRVNTFEKGDIFFWDDAGAVDVKAVEITYKGHRCFDKTAGPGDDEIYVVYTVVGPNEERMVSGRTGIVDVGGPGVTTDDHLLYKGNVSGVGGLVATMMEHDAGSPDAHRAEVEAGVRAAIAAAGFALSTTALPVGIWATLLSELGAGPIADAINKWLGTGDDHLGTDVFALEPKQLIALAKEPQQVELGLKFRLVSRRLNRHGGSYTAHFDVRLV